jgi:hypothetical protein
LNGDPFAAHHRIAPQLLPLVAWITLNAARIKA